MTAPLNFELLREITDGDQELEKQLLSLYFATVDRCMGKLHGLIENDGENGWKRVVHELKGASANIYAEPIANLCRQIEHLPNDPDERKRAYDHLKISYAELKIFLGK